DGFGDAAVATLNLPAHAQDVHVIRIGVVDREVIEDIAELRPGANLSAAHAEAAGRMAIARGTAERPVDDIEVVDVLFTDVIAGEPGEVKPIADLPFDIGHVGGAGGVPETALIPVAAGGGDGADVAAVDVLHRFDVAGLITALGAGHHGQVVAVGFLERSQHHADAGAIDADRFLGEQILAGGDHGANVVRAEAG